MSVEQSAGLQIRLLGRFAALRDEAEVASASFGGRKVRTLVKVLATRQGRFVNNDLLAEALWPDRLPADPVANLQVLVNRARHALGEARAIVTGQGGYLLAGPPACRVDAEDFLAAAAHLPGSSARLREVLSWWAGEPLPEELYEDWAQGYRLRLLRARQLVLEAAARLALEEDDPARAVELAAAAVEAEPLRESAAVLLVRALWDCGDGAAALTAYDEFRRGLADELGVDPSPEAAALHQRILQGGAIPAAAMRPRRGRRLSELPFVGRDAELASITAVLTRRVAEPGVVVVAGASGSGKSRLLDRVAQGVPLARVRAFASERAEPWVLCRTLVREVGALDVAHLAGLPAPMAAALAWLLPELDAEVAPPQDPETRRILVLQACLRVLARADVVVAVDDLQWCDPTSLGVLEAALARGMLPGVVVAFRPEEVPEDGEVAEFLARATTAVRIDLAGLPGSAVRDLITDPGVIAAIERHTDRTPLAVTEVLRALAEEGLLTPGGDGRWRCADDAASARAGELAREGQRRAIHARVVAQPAADRELLALLALLARESAVTVLAAATAGPEPAVLAILSRLLRRGLVRHGERGWATSHDMVTEVVAAGLDPAERARLHAALARALQTADDPQLLAHHLREAGDRPAAAAAFAQAAQRAFDSYADGEALELATAGLAADPPPATRAILLETSGQARQRLGDIPGARGDLRTALGAHASGPARARILARLAMLASGSDDMVRAARLSDLALVEAGDDLLERARALEVASVLDMNLGRETRAAQRAGQSLRLYQRLGDTNGMARILDVRAMAQFLGGDVRGGGIALRRAADLFEDSGDLVRVVTPRSTAGHALVFAGRAEEGLVQTTAALDLARTLAHPEGQAYALWHRTEAFAALGRFEDAAAAAAEARGIAEGIGHRGWTATAWRAVGIAAQGRGDLDAALAAFRRSLAVSEHLGLFACWAAARAAMALVALGDAAAARELAERALQEGPPLGHYEARWARVEVAAATGEESLGSLAGEALKQMDAGGVRQGRDRIAALAAASG